LKNDEGVSLERVSVYKPSLSPDNWFSASSESGYGTPTRRNSSDITQGSATYSITIENEIFSPDGDNFKDKMILRYHLTTPGYVANINIYDIAGRKISTLLSGKLIGLSGSFTWNGRDDMGSLVKSGYYIIIMEIYNMDGEYYTYKKKCAVSYPF
jgi:flagellar hook assembly protein FlgD